MTMPGNQQAPYPGKRYPTACNTPVAMADRLASSYGTGTTMLWIFLEIARDATGTLNSGQVHPEYRFRVLPMFYTGSFFYTRL
jgi:hypothetical protein